jgi:hypothetical protein
MNQFAPKALSAGMLLLSTSAGCINVNVPEQLFKYPAGTTFVIDGQALEPEGQFGGCLVWQANQGDYFVLSQDANLSDADFDAVMRPQTVSRLLLKARTDLGLACKEGATTADILQVYRVNGVEHPHTGIPTGILNLKALR